MIRPVAALLALMLAAPAALAQNGSAGGAALTADAARTDAENWRAVPADTLMIFETTRGRILIEMLPEAAPAHVEQFRTIVRSGDFDGTAFHRVIDGFMAQGGDIFALKGRESGLPNIPGEFTFRRDPAELSIDPIGFLDTATDGYIRGFPVKTQANWIAEMSRDGLLETYIPHCPGVVSTARTDDPNSANSQFFLMRGRAEHLDRSYTAWGRILEGQDVVDTLRVGEPPANPDILQRAVMASDLPEGERPSVWVQRTDGPAFRAELEGSSEADVCARPPVPAIVEG